MSNCKINKKTSEESTLSLVPFSGGRLNSHGVQKGEANTKARATVTIYDLTADVLNYMMCKFTNARSLLNFRMTSQFALCALKGSADQLNSVRDYHVSHQIDFGTQFCSRFLQLIANPTAGKSTALIKDATLDLKNLAVEDAANQLPQLKSRYERLQTIFNDLCQGLAVFNPSITAFLQILRQRSIELIKTGICLLPVVYAGAILWSLYTSSDFCVVLEKTGFLRFKERPCTYWEALQRILKALFNISGPFLMNGLTNLIIIAAASAALLVIITVIPGQMAQYRNHATTVLNSVNTAFQEGETGDEDIVENGVN